jgi:hypothetical protein
LHLVGAIDPALQNIQVANIVMILLHPIPHVVVAAVVVAAVAAAMRADRMVVEVVMTITAIVAAIEIRRSTRTLLVISVTVFLLVTSAAISLIMLMTVRPTRTYAASRMTQNMAPRASNSSLLISDKSYGRETSRSTKLRKYDGKENPES